MSANETRRTRKIIVSRRGDQQISNSLFLILLISYPARLAYIIYRTRILLAFSGNTKMLVTRMFKKWKAEKDEAEMLREAKFESARRTQRLRTLRICTERLYKWRVQVRACESLSNELRKCVFDAAIGCSSANICDRLS